jgi:hypothetical protein
LILYYGVVSSASREELEEMYSSVSSVPKISSGSRSRLEKTRGGKNARSHTEARSRLKENSLSNGVLPLGAVLPDGLLAIVHGLGVFSSGAGEKM